MHAGAEGVKICIVVCGPAEKRELGRPIERQIDTVLNAARTLAEVYAGLLRAVRRIECEGVVLT